MLTWIKKLFRGNQNSDEFITTETKIKRLKTKQVSLWTQKGIDAYERAKTPLKEKNETIAKELVIASNNKDKAKARALGKQLNSGGGIERMKLICYRVRHLGGDDRWLEMIWSGIGKWMG